MLSSAGKSSLLEYCPSRPELEKPLPPAGLHLPGSCSGLCKRSLGTELSRRKWDLRPVVFEYSSREEGKVCGGEQSQPEQPSLSCPLDVLLTVFSPSFPLSRVLSG